MRLWQQVSIKHLVWVTRMTCWFLLKVEKITTKFIIKKLRKILEELLHSIFLRISLRWASMANISCTPLPYLTFIVSRLFCAGCLAAVQTDRWCLATPKQPWMQMQHLSFVCTIAIRAYCQLYCCDFMPVVPIFFQKKALKYKKIWKNLFYVILFAIFKVFQIV